MVDLGTITCGSDGKESACNVGDLGLVPGLGRSPGEGKGYPLQYSGLENFMDYTVHVGFSCGSEVKVSACNAEDQGSIPGLGRSLEEGISYPLQCSWASLVGSAGKESACVAEDLGLIPGLGRSPGGGHGNPLQ